MKGDLRSLATHFRFRCLYRFLVGDGLTPFPMSEHLLIWNVRGLNCRARRCVVRDNIKADVVSLFAALWDQDWRSFHHINGAIMTLIPKTSAPSGLKDDYRPISLIHSVSKLFSKCLANRLAPRISELMRANQTAFIKGRRIHDNFWSVQLTCRWLYVRQVPRILLKVDLAKAFDSVAWPFLLEVLEHVGFPPRWRDWIAALLSTASTRVLVNGRRGRRICHTRGLRQGDPLSPFLFLIVMEVLNSLLEQAELCGMLSPLPGDLIKFRSSIYADDLVIFLRPEPHDFACIKEIPELFVGASGLLTNLDKCLISPIRCTDESIAAVEEIFSCTLSPFPCKYLGAPLSVTSLKRTEEQRLVDAVAAKIPTWKANMLNTAGRLVLTKSTLSAIPVHISITCCLSSWAIAEIDRRRRAFLWCGTDRAAGGRCKVAWPIVCAPKELWGSWHPRPADSRLRPSPALGMAPSHRSKLHLGRSALQRGTDDHLHVPGIGDCPPWRRRLRYVLDGLVAASRSSFGTGAAPIPGYLQAWQKMDGEGGPSTAPMGPRHLWCAHHGCALRVCYPLGETGRRRPPTGYAGSLHLEVDRVRGIHRLLGIPLLVHR